VPATGPAGGIYANELFSEELGEGTIFIPSAGPVRPMGRVALLVVPATELATTVHAGPHTGIDRAYGSLATYVTQHALAIDGPIREYYLVGLRDTACATRPTSPGGGPRSAGLSSRPGRARRRAHHRSPPVST